MTISMERVGKARRRGILYIYNRRYTMVCTCWVYRRRVWESHNRRYGVSGSKLRGSLHAEGNWCVGEERGSVII